MKKTIYILLILSSVTVGTSQNWTEPVNVSNMNDFILNCDFTIDNEGIIHCVWNLKYDLNYGIILYAYSEDDGNTWSDAISISQNDTNYCTSPHIVHDSQNNLYVVYDLNNYDPQNWGSYACFVKKDTLGWAEPLTLSEGITTRLAINNNDRVYVFWFMGAPHTGEFYYQFLEEETWSDVFCPYDNNNKTNLNEVVVDDNNNLHCVGVYDEYDGPLETKIIYYIYDYENDQWSDLTLLSEGSGVRDNDIALDTNQLPHICWEEGTTYYSFFDGMQWSEKEAVASNNTYRVVIEIDNSSQVHIATTEETEEQMNLVYHYRPDGFNWDNMIVDQCNNTIFTPEFEMYNNQLYLVYKISDEPGFGDVYLTKLNLVTGMTDRFAPRVIENEICNYPNPFTAYTYFNFRIYRPCDVKLFITDLNKNQLTTIIDRWFEAGVYHIQWDGTNHQGNRIPSGIYLYTFKTNTGVISKKMAFIY